MVLQIPNEYMHLLCLGIMRKLLNLWLKGDLKYCIPQSTVAEISAALIDLRPAIPKEFCKYLDPWKATEFRQLLLYTGPLVSQLLPLNLYNHFMSTLHVAISFLCMPEISSCDSLCNYAYQLLKNFVVNFSFQYGKDNTDHLTF